MLVLEIVVNLKIMLLIVIITIVRILITERMIISIKEEVTKIIIATIKWLIMRTACERKKPWLEQEADQVKTHEIILNWSLQALCEKNLKRTI